MLARLLPYGPFLGAALLLGACDMPAPVDPTPDPEPPLQEWEGPRRMDFIRLPDLENGIVHDLDLDVDGMSMAVTQSSLSVRKIWVNRGAGWTLFTEPGLSASAVCIEPGGDHVFVGLNSAQYAIFTRAGALVQSPARYNVAGEGNEVDTWTTRQCAWVPERGDRVFVTLSSEDRTRGALLHLDVSRIQTSASWTRVAPPIQRATGSPSRQNLAFDGLSVTFQSGFGVGAQAGVAYGSSANALTQHTIDGTPLADPDDSWIIRDPFAGTAQYGAPRDFGSFPQRGFATLFRDIRSGSFRIIVSPPTGYRGVATLEAPTLSGSALAVDVDAAGHLWVGGSGGLGLHRSTEPLRIP
jgi:hypothetical protein